MYNVTVLSLKIKRAVTVDSVKLLLVWNFHSGTVLSQPTVRGQRRMGGSASGPPYTYAKPALWLTQPVDFRTKLLTALGP